MPKPPSEHPTCKTCRIAKVCKFRGSPQISVGEFRESMGDSSKLGDIPNMSSGLSLQYWECQYYRCLQGEKQALTNIKEAAKGTKQWIMGVVEGKKTPLLEVKTFKGKVPLKHGWITPEGEWVVKTPDSYKKTGQRLPEDRINRARYHIEKGIKRLN